MRLNHFISTHSGGLLSLGTLSGFVAWLVWPVLRSSGLPFGTDVHGHLARVWYMTEQLKESGSLPEWLPHWYNGTAISQYYPPLATLVMLPMQLATDNITITYGIFVSLTLLAAAGFTYGLARRWATPQWAALAAFLYVSAPFNVRTIFSEGNLPRALELAVIPAVVWAMFLVLEKADRRSVLLLILTTVVLILTHHQQGGLVLIGLAPIPFAYLNKSAESRFRIFTVFGAFIGGIILSSWWLLPALTHIDYPTVPDVSLIPERLHLFSMSFDIFDPTRRDFSIEAQYFGLSLAVFGSIAAVARPSRRTLFMLGAAVLSIVLSFGDNTILWKLFPIEGIFPERFLHLPLLLFALLVAEFGTVLRRVRAQPLIRGGAIALLLVLVVLDFRAYWDFPRLSDYPVMSATLDQLPPMQPTERMDGRGWPGGSIAAFLPIMEQGRRLSYGWSIETTPHLPVFSHHNTVIREDHAEFIARNYKLWNVRTAMVNVAEQPLIDALEADGFETVVDVEGNIGLISPEPAQPVMALGANSIVIGRGRFVASTALPWMSYATSSVVDDIDDEYLDSFDLILLFDFEFQDRSRLERRIRNWVASGKTVLMDLTRMPDPELFGVAPEIVEIPPDPVWGASDSGVLNETRAFSEKFGSEDEPWRGVTYNGLDEELVLVMDSEGVSRPVLGVKQIAGGNVYYLGLNLFTHLLFEDDQQSRDFLTSFAEQADVFTQTGQPGIEFANFEDPSDDWKFTASLEKATRVLVSETWSPHWDIQSNGKSVPIMNHENLLLIDLPAGEQEVRFIYKSTPVQWAGWGLTGVFAIGITLLMLNFRRLSGTYGRTEYRLLKSTKQWVRKIWEDDDPEWTQKSG